MIKNLPTVQETQVQPLEKEMTTHSRILAWEIPWIEEPGGLWSMGLQRVRYSWVTNTHRLGKGGTEKLSKLLKVTQMVTSKARIWSQARVHVQIPRTSPQKFGFSGPRLGLRNLCFNPDDSDTSQGWEPPIQPRGGKLVVLRPQPAQPHSVLKTESTLKNQLISNMFDFIWKM